MVVYKGFLIIYREVEYSHHTSKNLYMPKKTEISNNDSIQIILITIANLKIMTEQSEMHSAGMQSARLLNA